MNLVGDRVARLMSKAHLDAEPASPTWRCEPAAVARIHFRAVCRCPGQEVEEIGCASRAFVTPHDYEVRVLRLPCRAGAQEKEATHPLRKLPPRTYYLWAVNYGLHESMFSNFIRRG